MESVWLILLFELDISTWRNRTTFLIGCLEGVYCFRKKGSTGLRLLVLFFKTGFCSVQCTMQECLQILLTEQGSAGFDRALSRASESQRFRRILGSKDLFICIYNGLRVQGLYTCIWLSEFRVQGVQSVFSEASCRSSRSHVGRRMCRVFCVGVGLKSRVQVQDARQIGQIHRLIDKYVDTQVGRQVKRIGDRATAIMSVLVLWRSLMSFASNPKSPLQPY